MCSTVRGAHFDQTLHEGHHIVRTVRSDDGRIRQHCRISSVGICSLRSKIVIVVGNKRPVRESVRVRGSVCVRVCVRVRVQINLCVCVRVRVRDAVSMYMSARVWLRQKTNSQRSL